MYAKWRIFVHQVATFAGVGVREGLGHQGGAERRNYLCNQTRGGPRRPQGYWVTSLDATKLPLLPILVVPQLLEVISTAVEEPALIIRRHLQIPFGKCRQVGLKDSEFFCNGVLYRFKALV